jgi:pyruvoyl-dependent arginine decarboxylase (PvlArgDC)
MSETWWRVSFSRYGLNDWRGSCIEEVEVIASTDKTVTPKGKRRSAKLSEYHAFFPTAEEAYTHAEQVADEAVKRCQKRLEEALLKQTRLRLWGKVMKG